jgi:hypothetical protein
MYLSLSLLKAQHAYVSGYGLDMSEVNLFVLLLEYSFSFLLSHFLSLITQFLIMFIMLMLASSMHN